MDCLKADLACHHKHHMKVKSCACERSQHQTQRKMPALLRLDSAGEEGGVLSVPTYHVGSKSQDTSSKRKNFQKDSKSKSADSISPHSSVQLSFSSSSLGKKANHNILQKCNSLTEVSSRSNSFSPSKSSAKPNLKSCSLLSLPSADFSSQKNSVAKMNELCAKSNSVQSSTKTKYLGSILCSAMTMYPAVAMKSHSECSPQNISKDRMADQKFQQNCSSNYNIKDKGIDQENASLLLSQDLNIRSAKESTCDATMPSLYSKPHAQDNIHAPVQVDIKANSNTCSMQDPSSVDVSKECSVSGLNETSSSCDSKVNGIKNTSTKLNDEKDLSFVLMCQRKKHKKGRPSAKKQKKRQRSKSKHSPTPIPLASSSPLATKNESHKCCDKSDDSLDASVVFTAESEHEITKDKVSESSSSHIKSPSICFEEPFSAKVTCKNPMIARVLCASSSDESDCEDDSDGDEWGDSFNGSLAITSNHAIGFDIALSVDSLFKPKAVHSLKSVLFSDSEDDESETESSSDTKNSVRFTLSVSLPECDSASSCVDSFSQASVFPEEPLPLDANHIFGFTQGSFVNKEISGNSATLIEDARHGAEKGVDDDAEENLCQINAKWDRVYPTAGFRSCASESTVINSPSVRVKFAHTSQLETIHVVGAEDRKGTWHLYAVDRERFQRRIQEINDIISPILSDSHRAKIKQYINEQLH